MKKIISLILSAVILLVPAFAASAEDDSMLDIVINRLAEYTPEQRENLIAYARPFITTDTGVDAAITNIQTGTMSGLITGLVGDVLDEATLIRMFRSFTCIKEDTGLRLTYADILQKKSELEDASSSTLSGVQKLMNAMFLVSPAAEKVFTEDGIGAGVVANLLTIIPAINDEKTMVSYKDGIFEVDTIDQTFQNDFDAVWEGYTSASGSTVTYYKVVDRFVRFLNSAVPQSDKSAVAKALDNLGICDNQSTTGTGGTGSGTGGTGGGTGGTGTGSETDKPDDTKPTDTETDEYTVLTSYDGITDAVLGGGFILKTKANIAEVIEISTPAGNPMVYEFVSGDLIPVKYSVPSENGILAKVKENSIYVVKSALYPFEDANGWGKSYIAALYNRGIINGKSETTFAPDDSITREEFVKLVVELFELNDTSLKVAFQDVAEDAWYYSYVASAYQHNIISGVGDNLFGTGQAINVRIWQKLLTRF